MSAVQYWTAWANQRLRMCRSFLPRVVSLYVTVHGLSRDSEQSSRAGLAPFRAAEGFGTKATCNLVNKIRQTLTVGKANLVRPLTGPGGRGWHLHFQLRPFRQ